jgi:uncharacterized protein with ATP-grasp and redox domains
LTAKSILYIGDNAGETVFDRILMEHIKKTNGEKNIYFAVKEKPTSNDAMMRDALECGIDGPAEIISSGSGISGTVLSMCSPRFLELFNSADMVISKGQGNYEGLSGVKRRVFFLLAVKCAAIAGHIGCNIGDHVLIKHGKKIKKADK